MMPRGRYVYLRDRLSSRRSRRGDYARGRGRDRYPSSMDYDYNTSEYNTRSDYRRNEDRHYPYEPYMDYQQPRESYRVYDYDYDMRRDYARGRNRGPEYNRDDDYRYDRNYRDYRMDYADEEMDKEYHEDLMDWIKKLKKMDRFNLSKEQAVMKAKEMNVKFDEFDEDEFYAIYLMHVSDYPQLANEPHTYLAMAKAWLEDKDLHISPSEKVCKYLYEIVMAKEDED